MKQIHITLPGRPATKKNSMTVVNAGGRRIPIQGKAFKEYEKACLVYLKTYKGDRFTGEPIHMCARYYMPNRRSWPDLVGLLQATCDILEKAGIINNDRDIVSFDGSMIAGVDEVNPRTEITLTEWDVSYSSGGAINE